jgi:hypothetical protein
LAGGILRDGVPPGADPERQGEVIMTREFTHIPEQSSRFNNIVMATLVGAVGVLVAVLNFAPYSLI